MKIYLRIILIVGIIGIAAAVAFFLIKTKPTARKKTISIGAPLVETLAASPVDERMLVQALGKVVPAREVTLFPQVSGKIEGIGAKFQPGGRFREGEELLKIDDRDYQILARQREADVSRVMLEFKMEKGRKMIAEQEWDLLSSEINPTDFGRDLALHKPQLESAEAALLSARSNLRKAQLDIERSFIKAPFNAVVVEKFVDRGQYVSPGSKLVSLVGIDEFWIQLSIPAKHLGWLKIPEINAESGSLVTILEDAQTGKKPALREGRIVRLLADVDPTGQMARLLVSVKDPYNLDQAGDDTRLPLLLGSYVNVVIEGSEWKGIYPIPRHILRENDRVWIAGPENRLEIRDVSVIWKTNEFAYLTGLQPGEIVITSNIATPVSGMQLRLASESPTPERPATDPKNG